MISNNDKNNLRCKYNAIGQNYLTSTRKSRIRGRDMVDKSREYYATIRIANTYDKTEYVRFNGEIIKLNSMLKYLRIHKIKWYISSDRKYITTNENGTTTYKITYTNACIVNGNKIDRKQQQRIYNGK